MVPNAMTYILRQNSLGNKVKVTLDQVEEVLRQMQRIPEAEFVFGDSSDGTDKVDLIDVKFERLARDARLLGICRDGQPFIQMVGKGANAKTSGDLSQRTLFVVRTKTGWWKFTNPG